MELIQRAVDAMGVNWRYSITSRALPRPEPDGEHLKLCGHVVAETTHDLGNQEDWRDPSSRFSWTSSHAEGSAVFVQAAQAAATGSSR